MATPPSDDPGQHPRLSNTQVDQLGDRLRAAAAPDPPDAQLYFDHREAHAVALREVEAHLKTLFPDISAVSRLKTLDSVIAKLLRQRTRLSTLQDIAGCRLIVAGLAEQDALVSKIAGVLSATAIEDLRENPHHGYQAVHVIMRASVGLRVELQVRTELQDIWAQFSEKIADIVGIGFKYGDGAEDVNKMMLALSDHAARNENLIKENRDIEDGIHGLTGLTTAGEREKQRLLDRVTKGGERLEDMRRDLLREVEGTISSLDAALKARDQ